MNAAVKTNMERNAWVTWLVFLLLLFPSRAEALPLSFAGAETGPLPSAADPGEFNLVTGTVAITGGGIARSGNYAYVVTTTSDVGTVVLPATQTALATRTAFKVHVTTAPTTTQTTTLTSIQIGTAGLFVARARLVYATSGSVTLELGQCASGCSSGDALVGAPVAITPDVYHVAELRYSVATNGLVLVLDGVTVATGTPTTQTLTRVAFSGATNLSSAVTQVALDDLAINSTAAAIGYGSVLVRQGSRATPPAPTPSPPTDNAWTKTGGTTIDTVWSQMPISLAEYATSTAINAQTMRTLTWGFAAGDVLNACKIGVIAQYTGGTGTVPVVQIRRRVPGQQRMSGRRVQHSWCGDAAESVHFGLV